jgi:glutamine amidotransferase-like uncharacterized protein
VTHLVTVQVLRLFIAVVFAICRGTIRLILATPREGVTHNVIYQGSMDLRVPTSMHNHRTTEPQNHNNILRMLANQGSGL